MNIRHAFYSKYEYLKHILKYILYSTFVDSNNPLNYLWVRRSEMVGNVTVPLEYLHNRSGISVIDSI
jgi:hypothetical protein